MPKAKQIKVIKKRDGDTYRVTRDIMYGDIAGRRTVEDCVGLTKEVKKWTNEQRR
jgi:hypothetical protein